LFIGVRWHSFIGVHWCSFIGVVVCHPGSIIVSTSISPYEQSLAGGVVVL
jgi:hypothetical protein